MNCAGEPVAISGMFEWTVRAVMSILCLRVRVLEEYLKSQYLIFPDTSPDITYR